ncbi:hypothetical protein EYF80_065539 [Liparis tanakae]|uniref:Uncharacterized protein n=1 Tax=Liparis tanakae TaxID=230148 RepID=A0A4Z2E6F6_9TELE|nr:hypothetical protein EYF80_065539 [Liparis tanakae]
MRNPPCFLLFAFIPPPPHPSVWRAFLPADLGTRERHAPSSPSALQTAPRDAFLTSVSNPELSERWTSTLIYQACIKGVEYSKRFDKLLELMSVK